MDRLQRGDRFTAEIDRISKNGNGIIDECQQRHLNIGPVKQDSVGELVDVIILGGTYAWCLDTELTTDDYVEKLRELVGKNRFRNLTSTPPDGIDTGLPNSCPRCDAVVNRRSDSWACPRCDYEHFIDLPEMPPDQEGVIDEQNQATTVVSSHGKEPEEPFSSRAVSNSDEGEQKESISEIELEELRKRAKDEATESVSTKSTTVSTEKEQYNRSSTIRQYVLARADGSCEGCGKDAPFISKTGEPYLHAHHIHELSEGGSDTLDTVVALCPNCHYRVHHGEDGEEYNRELEEFIQKLENSS